MTIRIVDKPREVIVTSEEFRRYKQDYVKAYAHYEGPPVSLEDYILQRQVACGIQEPLQAAVLSLEIANNE